MFCVHSEVHPRWDELLWSPRKQLCR